MIGQPRRGEHLSRLLLARGFAEGLGERGSRKGQPRGGARGMREADQIDALIGTHDSWPGCATWIGASSAAIVTRCAAPGAAGDRTI